MCKRKVIMSVNYRPVLQGYKKYIVLDVDGFTILGTFTSFKAAVNHLKIVNSMYKLY